MHFKDKLKHIGFIKRFYYSIHKIFFISLVILSPKVASKYRYRKAYSKKLDLVNPKDFNQKLHWLNLYYNPKDPLTIQCADKYRVREYINKCGCGEILNELNEVYDDASKIDWDVLPSKFVIKTTNASGTNIICTDKKNLDIKATSKLLSKWMKTNYSFVAGELHYAKIKPRIICEKYLESQNGVLPNDYKIYCFNGKPELILVATDRDKLLKLYFVDLQWNKLNIGTSKFNIGQVPEKPFCLNEMIKYSERLSKPFPFVRIDFYSINGKPIFGEMTFTPAGCNLKYTNDFGLELLGNMLDLSQIKLAK